MSSKAAKAAADHQATLTTFSLVAQLLEGGGIYDPKANATAQKIIKLCRAEEQRQLARYDAAMSSIKEPKP